MWVIWSEEHKAWWAPDRCGYTNSLKKAGRYSLAEARAIEKSANIDGRVFNEVAILLPDHIDELIEKETMR
jgi:hypothetical protein